ncbi:hypothetical protein CKM354_001189200 [Cercospora kikuchii]|uniref:Endonuclease/exonuclease/phosphatase domain-containing protein n=1 Tax=Cercospora kikuchii TaxID=84275 RepID=A0A9P3CTW4_9PEZI|nr:inositol phosphosphingolipid phospholipase [Cercospora kikuchii]GIZ48848.1 hypothetical protein CKM354_001189200 [Cercospora kikuchii]
MASSNTGSSEEDLPSSIRIISLNCWGLKFISKYRHERLLEIGHQLATASPQPQIVGLQECWTQEDFLAIRSLTKHILPYSKFYWSGIFGGGLAILSAWPIEESSMFRYPLNGRPQAFWRGDWYVGKGVACARIRFGGKEKDVIEVFTTHLHAPYEKEPNDSYICHRTAQAWEIAKLMRHARERGHVVVGLGDFNMVPGSLAHRLVEGHGAVRDVWRVKWPESLEGSAELAGNLKGRKVPSARECLDVHGATCDSKFNTWRWSEQMRKDLHRGKEVKETDPEEEDLKAKRLDYIFFADNVAQTRYGWEIQDVEVGMRMRHPTLKCSLSDHFSIETTLVRKQQSTTTATKSTPLVKHLPPATYALIQDMIASYDLRERKQRKWRIAHFFASFSISIGCLIAVWWSPRNYVAFLLMLLSTLGLSTGVIDGLMGFLFVGSELRALREFKYEIDLAAEQAREREKTLSTRDSGVDGGERTESSAQLLDSEVTDREEIQKETGLERRR